MPTTGLRQAAGSLDAAFALARAQVADGTAPFVILGVGDARGVLRLEAFGAREDGTPITTDAVCSVMSITKPIVATCVMQLVEAGVLGLAEPMDRHLPELQVPGRLPFGAWHVLTHTSGVAEVEVQSQLERDFGRDELLRQAAAALQEAEPGTRFRYTTSTFDLLAELVARRLGAPFEEVLANRLLTPMGMADTTFDPRQALRPRIVPANVALADGGYEPQPPQLVDAFTELHMAGAGLWSTAGDLIRFGRAMLRDGELDGVRVLSPASLRLMTREITVGGLGAAPDPMEADHYALGWGKPGIASPASASAFGHGGVSGTRLWIDPDHDLVYVYLTGVLGYPLAPIDAVEHAIYAAIG
jgi:CubicO group peptidase (beta-lactamase class C family)